MTAWTSLELDVPAACAEVLSSALFDHGTAGIEVAEVGERIRLTAYFSASPDLAHVLRLCFALAREQGDSLVISRSEISDENWSENWKAHFDPIRVADTFFIHPPWIAPEADGAIAIVIEPKMAFGTGQHATTRGCLTMIARHVPSQQLEVAIDLGTGSGVLGIALAKVGAARVIAVDNDPIALACARDNAAANGVALELADELDNLPTLAGAIVANLYADLLIELGATMRRSLLEDGLLVCSGFLIADEAR
ncbi:MAG TPA: 50S ribosomal protein L11 methyltransferase, partial [Terriglobales bacterium]|nr:50S ribosomal protein L11 methyltransferase [Terriglobales bacterium]